MYSDDQYKQGETFREEWYKSRNYPLTISWNALPVDQKDEWVRECLGTNDYLEIQ